MTLIYEGAISSSAVGGARLHFRGMARALQRAGVDPLRIVLPRFRGESMYDPGVTDPARVHGVPTLRRSLAGHLLYEALKTVRIAAIRLRDVARRRRTIHMMRISPIGVSPLFSRLLGASVVVEVNGLPDGEFESRGFNRLVVASVRAMTTLQLRSATHVVAVTDGLAEACAARTSAPILRIENAVDLEDLEPSIRRAGSGAPHTITYSGAFAPWQELELLVEAFASVAERQPAEPWRLLLVGDGEDRGAIEAAIARCGVSDSVEITGWLDRDQAVERVLEGRIATVPLTPKSDSGICGSPLKLFEYLAVGRTVVGSDVDGIVELDDYPVIVYRHGDVASCAAALEAAASAAVGTSVDARASDVRLDWDDRCARLLEFVGGWAGRS